MRSGQDKRNEGYRIGYLRIPARCTGADFEVCAGRHLPLLVLLLVVLPALTLSGCCATIHIYPEEDEPITESTLTLQALVDRDPPLYYKEVAYDTAWNCTVTLLDETPASAYTPPEGYGLRVIMDLYQGQVDDLAQTTDQDRYFLERHEALAEGDALPPQYDVALTLSEGDYFVLAWADYVPEDNPTDWHYLPDGLTAVTTDLDTYPDEWHLRSSAAGQEEFVLDFTASPEGYPALQSAPDSLLTDGIVPVNISRPSGRYRVVSTDAADYVFNGGRLEGITVQVTYKQFVSDGYNVATQTPNSYVSTYSFTRTAISTEESDEFDLVGDYLFTAYEGETIVLADLAFYDAEGYEVNTVESVEIPLKRNHETIIRGPFLTRKLSGGGSVSIDENFTDEYVVPV